MPASMGRRLLKKKKVVNVERTSRSVKEGALMGNISPRGEKLRKYGETLWKNNKIQNAQHNREKLGEKGQNSSWLRQVVTRRSKLAPKASEE